MFYRTVHFILSFFLSFDLFLPTHCKCRGLQTHLITLNHTQTHIHTHTHSLWDISGGGIGTPHRPLPDK